MDNVYVDIINAQHLNRDYVCIVYCELTNLKSFNNNATLHL